ncbi:MAG: hypothetical protein N2555_01980, partial [Endomicrobia bacterium]|nr:hypothetical protein [Endomicrobiia bacterium]
GSALTLASFIKVVYSLFLSSSEETFEKTNIPKKGSYEKFYTILPMGILAVLCFIFGVFAFEIPINRIIRPMLTLESFHTIGEWNAKVAVLFILLGIIFGFVIYLLFVKRPRVVKSYMLGEEEKIKGSVIPATDFYLSIKETYPFSLIYHLAEQKLLDFYNWFYGIVSFLAFTVKSIVQLEIFDVYAFGKKIVFRVGSVFSSLHSGNLHTYLAWVFISILILTLIFIL